MSYDVREKRSYCAYTNATARICIKMSPFRAGVPTGAAYKAKKRDLGDLLPGQVSPALKSHMTNDPVDL